MKFLPSELLPLARELLSRPGAHLRLVSPDGSINVQALRAELARMVETEELSTSLDASPKVGRKREKGWNPLRQPTAGKMSGHHNDDVMRRRILSRRKKK